VAAEDAGAAKVMFDHAELQALHWPPAGDERLEAMAMWGTRPAVGHLVLLFKYNLARLAGAEARASSGASLCDDAATLSSAAYLAQHALSLARDNVAAARAAGAAHAHAAADRDLRDALLAVDGGNHGGVAYGRAELSPADQAISQAWADGWAALLRMAPAQEKAMLSAMLFDTVGNVATLSSALRDGEARALYAAGAGW